MDDSEAQFALTRYSQQLWDEISEELPREVEHDACGTIWIAADDEEMDEARRKEKFYSDRGVRVEVLDAHSLAEAEPNLRPGLIGGLRVPGDSVIYPPCAAQFFVDQAIAKGAALFLGKAVETITADGVRLRDGTSISAGVIVNSAGSWSPTVDAGARRQEAQRTSRHNRSLSEFSEASTRRARLLEERAFAHGGFSCIQHSTAKDRAVVDWFVAAVWR